MASHSPTNPKMTNESDLTTNNDDNIPEEDETLTTTEQDNHTFSPPARIAARFARPPVAPRRSSATSSRRNSLSSHNSLQSNSSYANARRNNSVAQYLRRASIIQSRKDRLAAREAHCEQVRLRAALAKSAPRSSNSEERAAAAEQARKEHLARVAATCAEEVRRAKKVAEENKARKAAEEEKARLEIQERHAEAERRRAELKRNTPRRSRTASSPTAPELKKRGEGEATIEEEDERPSLEPEVAAKRIQSAWRIYKRKVVLDRYARLGLSVDKVHEVEFETIKDLLNQDSVLKCTRDVVDMLGLQTEPESSASSSPQDHMAIRQFLSAYMILGHPQTVLSQDGDLEQTLITKAKDLMISFEAALSSCTASNHYTAPNISVETLRLAYTTFLTAFSDWKAQDSSLLVEMMIASFVSLESIWQSVKDDSDGSVADDYRDGIRNNQIQLLARINKLVGREKGKHMVGAALKEHRRKQRRKIVGNMRPKVLEGMPHAPTEGEGTSEALQAVATAATVEESAPNGPGAEMAALSKVFSVFPSSNRILAHELALDKEYRVDISPHSQLHDQLNRQICEQMRSAFQRGEGGAWTVAMAENIRHKLLHLVKHSNTSAQHPLQPVIAEALDEELILRQVALGVFSYTKFFSFMATLLPKLCAPVRDQEVKNLADELKKDGTDDELIERLFMLLHVIDLLCLDYSNYMLTRAAPLLIREAAGYEHRLFTMDLENGVHSLDRMRRWWNNATVSLFTEATDRQDPHARPSLQKIYNRGLVDLTVAAGPLRETDVPETLLLDTERLKDLREQSVTIAVIGAILMTAKNLLKRDVRQQWKAEANRLWDVLCLATTDPAQFIDANDNTTSLPTRILSILESSRPMPPATKQHLHGTITRLLSQAANGRFTDAVAKILLQRLKSHVFRRLAADGSEERVRAATTAGESLSSSGLPEFVQRVGEMVSLLGRIGEVDRRAHGMWYEGVARVFDEEARLSQAAGRAAGA